MNVIKNSALGLTGIIGVLLSMFGIKVPFAEALAREHWRAGVAALLVVILMFPAAIGLFLYLVDANRFKGEIVQFVKVQTQRDLVLEGDIKVTFFPKLGLDSGKMSLSERNSAKEFASVNNARVYLAWLPLLKKQLVFERVEIDGIHANVTRLQDGTTNFDDLLISEDKLAPMTFDIDGVRITNSSVNWADYTGAQRFALRDLRLETGRLVDMVPSHLKASFHFNSETAKSDAKVELKSRLFFDHKAGRYEFAGLEGKLEGTAAGVNNVALNFKGNLDTHPAQGSLTAESVEILMAGKYGQRNIGAKLGVPKLQAGKGTLSGGQLAIDATMSQAGETLAATLQVPAFEIANKVLKNAELSADFDFKGDGRALQGKLAGTLGINFEAAPKLDIGNVSLNLAARHPALSGELAAKATGSIKADFDAQNADVDFKAKLDDSEIAGTVALRNFNHPAYTFALNANRLDLDSYLAADWVKRYHDDATPLDFGAIKELTASGTLRAGEFKLAKLKANKLAADIKVEQSVLTIVPTASFYGGTLTGSISVAAQEKQQITVKQNLKGVQLGALLADTSSAGKLAGKGDLAVDLSAEGDTVGAMRKSLNGTVSLALAHGSLAGIDLRAALLEGKNELGNPGDVRTRAANFAEKTVFTELRAVFNIKDGNSPANSFEMKSPLMRTAGEGDIALDSGNINYRLNTTVASAINRRSAGELADLKGVALPVRVSGPYAAPSIALDFAAASGDIVTKRIAAKAAAEQAAAKAAAAQAAASAPPPAPAPAKRAAKPQKRSGGGTK